MAVSRGLCSWRDPYAASDRARRRIYGQAHCRLFGPADSDKPSTPRARDGGVYLGGGCNCGRAGIALLWSTFGTRAQPGACAACAARLRALSTRGTCSHGPGPPLFVSNGALELWSPAAFVPTLKPHCRINSAERG